eukprot:819899-Pleurochrysis_carterae.AAC.1
MTQLSKLCWTRRLAANVAPSLTMIQRIRIATRTSLAARTDLRLVLYRARTAPRSNSNCRARRWML